MFSADSAAARLSAFRSALRALLSELQDLTLEITWEAAPRIRNAIQIRTAAPRCRGQRPLTCGQLVTRFCPGRSRPTRGLTRHFEVRARCDPQLGERSTGSFLEYLEVPDRVSVVLPLLLEDHMQALQHGVVFSRVARTAGRDAVPL
jgi:hypothetical protein